MSTKMQQFKATLARVPASSRLIIGPLLIAVGCFSGCGAPIGFSIGTTPTPATSLTGNWQFTATDSTGAPAFSNFAGFIDQPSTSALTAVFQVQPGSCYLGATNLPASGTVAKTAVNFSSFSVNGQYVYITATENSAYDQLTGTYQITGGCANGTTGTISGMRYAALTGTYTGAVGSSSQTANLTLVQGALGNGNGYSPITGSATFTGISCFTSATLNANSGFVIGSSVQLNFTASDGEVLAVIGTFDTLAKSITIASTTISGGSCAGQLGSGSLAQS